jgi:hypothetical protein
MKLGNMSSTAKAIANRLKTAKYNAVPAILLNTQGNHRFVRIEGAGV